MNFETILREVGIRRQLSQMGLYCGILGCPDTPTTKCLHCGNWYCEDHKVVIQVHGKPADIELVIYEGK